MFIYLIYQQQLLKNRSIFGQNYAFINAVDSLGDLIGSFSIENETNVKITSTSPPDGNNYTSCWQVILLLNEIFLNPNSLQIL